MAQDNEDMLVEDIKENEPDSDSEAVISNTMKTPTSAKHGWENVNMSVSYQIFIGYLEKLDVIWNDFK